MIGYNDIQMSTWAAYDLTTMRQPMGQMAALSVRLLMKRIDDGPPARPQRWRLDAKLIIRGSTGHAPMVPAGAESGQRASYTQDQAF